MSLLTSIDLKYTHFLCKKNPKSAVPAAEPLPFYKCCWGFFCCCSFVGYFSVLMRQVSDAESSLTHQAAAQWAVSPAPATGKLFLNSMSSSLF